jgi:hypothetical protein
MGSGYSCLHKAHRVRGKKSGLSVIDYIRTLGTGFFLLRKMPGRLNRFPQNCSLPRWERTGGQENEVTISECFSWSSFEQIDVLPMFLIPNLFSSVHSDIPVRRTALILSGLLLPISYRRANVLPYSHQSCHKKDIWSIIVLPFCWKLPVVSPLSVG